MTPEQINAAREWLADAALLSPAPIIDTVEEALEIAMEKILTERVGNVTAMPVVKVERSK